MVTDPSLFSVLDRVNSSSVASINLIYTDKRQLFIFLVAPRARPTGPGQPHRSSGALSSELLLYICIHVERCILGALLICNMNFHCLCLCLIYYCNLVMFILSIHCIRLFILLYYDNWHCIHIIRLVGG